MLIRTKDVLEYHARGRPGKIQVVPTKPCLTQRDLSMAYTPGVAEPCRAIVAGGGPGRPSGGAIPPDRLRPGSPGAPPSG